eukprot:TRINITY_DN11107_c0_g1_i1.p1 TRINITY_DN11107_c0_g1~~TRINITY_DN11107_c0_g1_i1.p1  ORF type:complete len:536 (-),score=95.77 TRINITY_DN11107_c0_g1_i1:96-1703(-)
MSESSCQLHGGKGLVKGHEGLAPSRLPNTFTRASGCPVGHYKNSLTAGPHGPVLLQDFVLMEKLAHFDRERTPPRNVHALGNGAYGHLTITHDISKYSRAKVFSEVGKKVPLFVRFSGIFTEQGEPETTRDPRGFALKFYTEEGNWDLLAINTPVFNTRDGKVGPDAIHAFKRDPRSHEWNPTQIWDFVVNHPEGLFQTLMIYSDQYGTPMSYRSMNAYGCNTFSFWNEKNERFWVKFHILSEERGRGLNQFEAKLLAGEDPDFLSRDLREAIEQKRFPKWRFAVQCMKEEDGYKNHWAFDCTKIWSTKDYPLIDIGTIELNANPIDYLAEVEQVAFSPANVVPGISFSPDKLLQGRLMIYDDTQFHRLGPNFKQIPINRPNQIEPQNAYVSSAHQHEIKRRYPHYYPSCCEFLKPDEKFKEPPVKCDGTADFYDYDHEGTDEDYYLQASQYVRDLLSDKDRHNLVENIGLSLMKITSDSLVEKVFEILGKVDKDFSDGVRNVRSQVKEGKYNLSEGMKVWVNIRKQLNPQPIPE